MSYIQEDTFAIMSVQHELAMTIGNSLDLFPMLDHFSRAAIKCLNVQGIHFAFFDDFGHEFEQSTFSYPQCRDSDNAIHSTIIKQGFDNPQQTFQDNHYYHSYPIGTFGVVVLRRKNTALSPSIGYSLVPILRRLELACLACLEHHRVVREIKERARVQSELISEKNRIATTLNSIGDAVISTDASGQVEYINPIAETLLKIRSKEAKNTPVIDLLKLSIQGSTNTNFTEQLAQGLAIGESWRPTETLNLTNTQGESFGIDISASPIFHNEKQSGGHVIVIHDVTIKRDAEQRISWQASHDSLTSLTNRVEFENQLNELCNTSDENSGEHALLYIDLDQFKVINDTCGHLAGDGLLQQLATLMKTKIRKVDTLARIGGDEFTIILRHCSVKKAQEIAELIRHTVQKYRYTWDGKIFTLGVSIGLVPIKGPDLEAETIFAYADLACYSAKDHGRNQLYVYQAKEEEHAAKRHNEMEWVSRINDALENDDFILYCQGIYPLGAHLPTHIEILIRMQDGDKIIPPGAFLPAAERYSKIHALDLWVVRTVMHTLSENPLFISENSEYRININLAGPTLSDSETLDAIKQLMLEYPKVARILCLEITETSAITNIQKCLAFMEELTVLGCHFSLDDFGSGLSSFGYLKNLPVSQVKIDGEFVKDISTDKVDRAMVTSIHQIAQAMDIKTVAEFVEDDITLQILKDIGIDFGQGYGIETPLPFEEKLKQLDKEEHFHVNKKSA